MNELPVSGLTCRQVVELLADHLDDVEPRRERPRVEAHLLTCADCTAYVEQVRTTVAALAGLREDGVSAPVLDELVEAFRGWKGE